MRLKSIFTKVLKRNKGKPSQNFSNSIKNSAKQLSCYNVVDNTLSRWLLKASLRVITMKTPIKEVQWN